MGIAPLSNDNIKVGYITDDGYVSGVSLAAANEYEKLNPETVFIFINGDKKVKYLTIDGLYKAMGFDKRNDTYPQLTDHYFTGEYPVKIIDELGEEKVTQLSLLSTGSNN